MRRHVLFDLDGTLVDSLGDIHAHLTTALEAHGAEGFTATIVRGWIGHGARDLIAAACAAAAHTGAPRLDVDAVLATFRAAYAAAPVRATAPYPGVNDVLAELASTFTLGILSNKPHELTVAIAETLWPERFAVVHGARAGVPLKPDPASLAASATALGVDPAQLIYVGDSPVDVACARAAGCPVIAVTWGLSEAIALEAAAPDRLLSAVAELPAAIARLA